MSENKSRMPVSRREFTKLLLKGTLGAAALPAFGPRLGSALAGDQVKSGGPALVRPRDLDRIRYNLRQSYFSDVLPELLARSGEASLRFLRSKASFANRIWDIPKICQALRSAAVLTATEVADRTEVILAALDVLHKFPAWDYFVDGDKVIGLQRAPECVQSVVFALELLGDRLSEEIRSKTEKDLAEKGCLPCYRTLWGMDHPEQVHGWGFAEDAKVNFQKLDFRRWPWILRSTNLHAVPLAALGVGALHLLGHDDRAEGWLETATEHARWFCRNVYLPDGSYPEGISYWGYATEELLTFLWALEQSGGPDLFDELNLPGQVDFALALQAGRASVSPGEHHGLWIRDGKRADIVNFSDAKYSFRMAAMAWIAAKLRDPVAQRAAMERAGAWNEFALLALDPTVPVATEWPQHLAGVRLATGWVIWRTGWGDDDAVVAFRSGGPANHEHADRNTLILKAKGEWLLRDPFGAAYSRFDPKWLLRLTEAHNGLLINGKGHAYITGEEGTNSSKAEARIVRYLDRDVWLALSSDATQAYALVNTDVKLVVRTLIWLKPDWLVIFDQVRAAKPVEVSARFFPNNEDGLGSVEVLSDGFWLGRPKALARGWLASDVSLRTRRGQLPLKEQFGHIFAEVLADRASSVDLVTVLKILEPTEPRDFQVHVAHGKEGWRAEFDGWACEIDTTGEVPEVSCRAL
ncbi:MAG: hypothetical protein GXO73_06710 [Calditrichaeota bacterium]|nr:hypothetical protein [Calditrichota bacterium]